MQRKHRLILALVPGVAWLLAMAPALAFADEPKAIMTVKGALTCVF